jgi:hypothetical protein
MKRSCCWPGDWRRKGRRSKGWRWSYRRWRAGRAAARRIENSTRLGRLAAASRSTEAGLIAWFKWAWQARGAFGCRLSAKSTAVIDGPASHALRRGSTTGNIVSAPAAECQRGGAIHATPTTPILLARCTIGCRRHPRTCRKDRTKTCRGTIRPGILKKHPHTRRILPRESMP